MVSRRATAVWPTLGLPWVGMLQVEIDLTICLGSATNVSIVVVARPCYARTSGREGSASLEGLLSTLPSTSIPIPRNACGSLLTRDRPVSPQHKLYKINRISDLEATLGTLGPLIYFPICSPLCFFLLAEPLACAIHGVDVIQPKVGSEGANKVNLRKLGASC